jgi:hypothetical protein
MTGDLLGVVILVFTESGEESLVYTEEPEAVRQCTLSSCTAAKVAGGVDGL